MRFKRLLIQAKGSLIHLPWIQTVGILGSASSPWTMFGRLQSRCESRPPPQSPFPNIYEWLLVHLLQVIPLAFELNVLSSCFLLYLSRPEIPAQCDTSKSWGLKGGDEPGLSLFWDFFLNSFCKTMLFKDAWCIK